MSTRFETRLPVVIVHVAVRGPHGTTGRPFALDTGASFTACDPAVLVTAGLAIEEPADTQQIAVVGGSRNVPLYRVAEVSAPGVSLTDMRVAAIPMPRNLGIHGLLGLDFIRGKKLTLDFRGGTIELD